MPSARLALALVVSLGALGCRDLERFDTHGNEAYCGELVGAPFHSGFLDADARPPVIGLRLTFDVDRLATTPGEVATDDAEQGICSPQRLLDSVPLRAVSEAFHDPISQLEFGDGRVRNVLVWVDTTCRGTLLGVVSLMRDESIEVRLLKPAPEALANTPEAERPGFALFHLTRRKQGCGY